jgi:transposase
MDVPECFGCRERDARIAELEARLLQLEGLVRDLQDKLKPPTSPRPADKKSKAPDKKKTGRQPGGQPGHAPRMRNPVPPERVNHVVTHVPERCGTCDAALPTAAGPNDPEPTRFQVAELPPLAAVITEHQGHARTCPCCGEVTRAPIPADIRANSVGPRLTAVLSYLAGVHGMSKRGLEEVVEQVFDAPIALGTVSNREREMSAALAAAHEEARAATAAAPIKRVDETGWKQAGKKRWLWAAATDAAAYFVIHARRNLKALRRVVGAQLTGLLSSDRWSVYDDWPGKRQLCWAHVKRNWDAQIDRGGAAARIGRAWRAVQRRVFELWHLFRGGGCTRAVLIERMRPMIVDALEVLDAGRRTRDPKLVRFCDRLADRFVYLWSFVKADGVEPTNNQAERVQRRAVLWRRRSFGCHSADGCRFVERILTVVETLRQQKRSVLTFLHEAIKAHRAGQPSPRLVMG